MCGRQGTSGMHSRGFHYLIFILMVKRIPLLALISSRTAVGSLSVFGLSLTSWVGPGKRATPRVTSRSLSLSLWTHRSGSQAVGLFPWIGGGGHFILVSLGVNSPA